MEKDKNTEPGGPQDDGEGHLILNIGKVLFLIAVLAAFWYFFDRWLAGE
jgi:hypothetical protein